MNRAIKFRAWDMLKKRWSNYKINDGTVYFMDKNTGVWYGSYNKRYKDFNLMQYTGIKDKNGKEIYEGDIVVNSDGDYGYVFFRDGVYNVRHDEYTGYLFDWDYEIKGNIYENLEILKKIPV